MYIFIIIVTMKILYHPPPLYHKLSFSVIISILIFIISFLHHPHCRRHQYPLHYPRPDCTSKRIICLFSEIHVSLKRQYIDMTIQQRIWENNTTTNLGERINNRKYVYMATWVSRSKKANVSISSKYFVMVCFSFLPIFYA
jgi:hypothetical protein